MYGYSRLGEVKKDSLGIGDILGFQKIMDNKSFF